MSGIGNLCESAHYWASLLIIIASLVNKTLSVTSKSFPFSPCFNSNSSNRLFSGNLLAMLMVSLRLSVYQYRFIIKSEWFRCFDTQKEVAFFASIKILSYTPQLNCPSPVLREQFIRRLSVCVYEQLLKLFIDVLFSFDSCDACVYSRCVNSLGCLWTVSDLNAFRVPQSVLNRLPPKLPTSLNSDDSR